MISRRRARLSVFAAVVVVCVLLASKADAFLEALVEEDQVIEAGDLTASDTFGSAVAVSGDTLVVGSKGDDDNGKHESGSVYVFDRVGGVWTQVQKLHSPTPVISGAFGVAVDIEGDTMVVGARAESGGIGNTYIFKRTGGASSWTCTSRIRGADVAPGVPAAKVGATVAIAGDYVAVGSFISKVWAFRHDAGGGCDPDPLVSPTPPSVAIIPGGAGFGATSMAMEGNLLVVGQKRVAAYIYDAGINFALVKTISRASVGGTTDWFASSVATDGTTVVVADLGADTVTPKIDNHGAGYVFRQDTGGAWGLVTTLLPDKVLAGGGGNLQAGYSAAVYGNTVALGSRADASQGLGSGSVFIFQEDGGGNWTQNYRLRTSLDVLSDPWNQTGFYNYLGFSTALESATVIAGAPGHIDKNQTIRGYVLSFDVDGSGAPPPPPPPTPTGLGPAAPSNLVATAISSNRIDLSWTDNSNNETYFKLQRKPQGGAWTGVTFPAADQTSFSDTGMGAGTWCYRIRSHNGDGFSDYVNSTPTCVDNSGGSPPPPPPPAGGPAAPSNVVATKVNESRIDLSWTDNANDENAFKLQRQPQGGSWTTVTWLGADATSYSDTGLTSGTWCYRVRSHNGDGFSAWVTSNCVAVGGGGGGQSTGPAAPSNFTAVSPTSNRIDLSWQDNSNDEFQFKLQWSLAGTDDWTTIWIFKDEESYSHTGLTDGSYCYRIRTHSASGFSNYVLSEPQCIRTGSGGSASVGGPAAPSDFVAVARPGRVDLTWTDQANNELGYKLQWWRPGGDLKTVWINADEESFTHVAPTMPDTFCYRIRSYDAALESSNYVLSQPQCVAVAS